MTSLRSSTSIIRGRQRYISLVHPARVEHDLGDVGAVGGTDVGALWKPFVNRRTISPREPSPPCWPWADGLSERSSVST
jgi:hypothetical protein